MAYKALINQEDEIMRSDKILNSYNDLKSCMEGYEKKTKTVFVTKISFIVVNFLIVINDQQL